MIHDTLTAARLRSLTCEVIACSPVRFLLPDGTELEWRGWRTNGPVKDAEGKPTGIPVLIVELGWPAAVPALAQETPAS